MIIKKYAAIDIGSNAIRLLICTYSHAPKLDSKAKLKKTSLVRIPVRLGSDVFIKGKISADKREKLEQGIHAYSLILKAYGITRFKACATSAMRSASNGKEIANAIHKKTGIKIDIIDGNEEAEYISSTDLHEFIKEDKNYLYVDVGGGSTEFTFYSKGEKLESRSFKIGTVRLLNNLVEKKEWDDLEEWIKKNAKKLKNISLIGSGGNINSIFKSSGKKYGQPLSREYLIKYSKDIKSLTYEERIILKQMKEDRADVIVHALDIFENAMKWAKSYRVYVPKIGLADGIIKTMINEDFYS